MIIDQLFTRPLFEQAPVASPEQLAYNKLRAQWDGYQAMTSGDGNTAVSRDPAHAAKLATIPAEIARMAAALKAKGIDAEAQYDALSGPAAAPVDANQAYGGLSENKSDPITQFASNAHEEWRRNFDPTGTKPRIKKNSDGTEGDINVPFEKLHPDWKKENLAAGHAAHHAVKHFGRDMEKAAEHVHNEWMKRNPKADYNAAQHVPYDDLSDDEKEKDRVHVRTMMRLMGHHPEQGVAEAAPPGARAERMVRHIKAGYAKDGKLTPKEKGIAFATAWKAHNAGRVEEGEVTKNAIGLKHRATDKYGAGDDEPHHYTGGRSGFSEPGKYARDLEHVNKQLVKDLDASMGISWKNRGTKGIEVDEQGVAEGSGQKPTITYKDYTLQYDYQTEDDDPEGYSTATTYYFDVFKDGKRVGEAEYFDYFGNLTIRINGKTKEFGFRHPLASQISQLVSSLPDEQKKDLSDPKFESQGVAEGRQIDEVFADQGSGSTDRDNADYMKRRNAAKKAGYTSRETKAGTWRVFKDGNAVAVAGPFKSADEAAAWIKKHKQGITEMDKSEPSAGRDGGPRPGPDREAKPISAKKATKDAADMLNRAFQDSHKKKDVKEAYPLGYSTDPAQGKWYQEGMDAVKYGTVGDSIKEIAKKHFVPPQWVEAFTAGFRQQEEWSREGAARGFPGGRKPEPYTKSKAMPVPPTFPANTNARGGGGAANLPDRLPGEHDTQLPYRRGMDTKPQIQQIVPSMIKEKSINPLMLKLQRAMVKEGRVKELADDLKTMSDADFMKKYGKAKAAIRKDMTKLDEARSDYTPDEMADMLSGKRSQKQIDADAERTRGPNKAPPTKESTQSRARRLNEKMSASDTLAAGPGISRLGKKDMEPEIDFRKGLVGDESEFFEPDVRIGKPVEPNAADTDAFMSAVNSEKNPYMQSWGGKYADQDTNNSPLGPGEFNAGGTTWRFVSPGERPGGDTISGTGTPDWRSIAAAGKPAAASGLPKMRFDRATNSLVPVDQPVALDLSPKDKDKFDRQTRSVKPADGSGANPNIDAATRDRARAWAAQQNAPGAALAGAMRSSGNPVDTTKNKTDWKSIYNLNKSIIGSNPNSIKPGMKLKMPDGSIYPVQPGDNLTKIAAKQSQIMSEAPKSAAVRLGNAIKRVQGTTAASQTRSVIPSSIPKPEPKKDEKDEKEAKKVDESRAARRALMARIVNGG